MMKNVSAAIIFKENKILLTRRAPGEKHEGYWEFPGGKQEENETIFECLEREILEELNVRCKAKAVFTESLYHYAGGAINLIAVTADIISGDICLSVHDKYEWVLPENLMTYKLPPADVPIAERIIKERAL